MIEISVDNDVALTFNIDDWKRLRKDHRIVGRPLGSRLNGVPSLPVEYSPEESLMLKHNNIVRFVTSPYLSRKPDEFSKQKYEEFKDQLFLAQIECLEETKRRELEGVIDKIIAGKRKSGDVRSKEEIFDEQLKKKCKLTKETMLFPTFCDHPTFLKEQPAEASEDGILKQTTPTKLAVFLDLWNRGYYITPGNKYGGDFLVYLGDPVLFHAMQIVKCVNPTEELHPTEIGQLNRLATSVKKIAVLASLTGDGKVSYISINRIKE